MSEREGLDWKDCVKVLRRCAAGHVPAGSVSSVVQDAVFKTLRRPPETHTLAYMIRVVRNECRTRWRSRMRQKAVLAEACAEAARCRPDPPNPLSRLMAKDEFERLSAMLMPLEMYVFVMYHVRECSYAEIASVLGTTVGSVSGILARARAKVCKYVEENDHADE